MKKLIDRILYFFGYAPVKISHEVKEIVIYHHSHMELKKLEADHEISLFDLGFMGIPDSNKRLTEKAELVLLNKLFDNVKNHVEILSIDDMIQNSIRLRAVLYVGVENNK